MSLQLVFLTVTVSIGLTSWMQSVCLVAVVQAFLFDTQPAALFLCHEADVAAPWQPVKVTSLEKKNNLITYPQSHFFPELLKTNLAHRSKNDIHPRLTRFHIIQLKVPG